MNISTGLRQGAVVLLILCLMLPLAVLPAEAAPTAARDLTCGAVWEGFDDPALAADVPYKTFARAQGEGSIRLTAQSAIGAVYVKFNHAPGHWTVVANDSQLACGEFGFLHEYVSISQTFGETREILLYFPAGAEITGIRVLGPGEPPEDVQVWNPPCAQADVLFLSAHADDEQLYFAGVIPYYAAVRGVRVQVAFLTEHMEENFRWHERLDALWANGVRNYPVVSAFPDKHSTTLEAAYRNFASDGFSKQDIVDWAAALIRRFRPLAAVTHSLTGEYGHGQHMAAADAMILGADRAADAAFVTVGLEAYNLPKLYLHNYGENTVRLDCVDVPSDKIGGKTPFYLSQMGYIAHDSQLIQYNDLKMWLYGNTLPVSHPERTTVTAASQITEFSPIEYGLYRTAPGVPADARKNDFLENLLPGSDDPTETQPEETTPVGTEPIETQPAETEPAETEPEQTQPVQTRAPGTDAAEESRLPAETLGQTPTRHKAFAVSVLIVALVVLLLCVYFGQKIIKKCDNP